MKNVSHILLAALLLGGGMYEGVNPKYIDVTPKEPPIPKGCKRFYFDGYTCIASSQNSANKKYKKFKANIP